MSLTFVPIEELPRDEVEFVQLMLQFGPTGHAKTLNYIDDLTPFKQHKWEAWVFRNKSWLIKHIHRATIYETFLVFEVFDVAFLISRIHSSTEFDLLRKSINALLNSGV